MSLDEMTMQSPPDSDPEQREEQISGGPTLRPGVLARDIFIILAIKAVALFIIWWVWFSAPEARRMQLPSEHVQQRVIDVPVIEALRSAQSFNSGNHDHATR